MEQDECCICLEALNDFTLTQPTVCNHIFHSECLIGLTSFDCPLCRTDLHSSLTRRQRKCINKNIKAREKSEREDLHFEFNDEEERRRIRNIMTLLCVLIAISQPQEYTLTINKTSEGEMNELFNNQQSLIFNNSYGLYWIQLRWVANRHIRKSNN